MNTHIRQSAQSWEKVLLLAKKYERKLDLVQGDYVSSIDTDPIHETKTVGAMSGKEVVGEKESIASDSVLKQWMGIMTETMGALALTAEAHTEAIERVEAGGRGRGRGRGSGGKGRGSAPGGSGGALLG